MGYGQTIEWQHYEQSLGIANTKSGGFFALAGAGCKSQYATWWNVATSRGIELLLSTQSGGPGGVKYQYDLNIPTLGILAGSTSGARVTGSSYKASMTAALRIDNFRVYNSGGAKHLFHDDIHFYVDGALHQTWNYSDNELINPYLTPIGIPLVGILPEVNVGAGLNPAYALPPTPGGSGASSSNSALTGGGWRFHDGTGWKTPPIVLPAVGAMPGSSCGCSQAAAFPSYSAANTNDAAIAAYATVNDTGSFVTIARGSGAIRPIPARVYEILRLVPDDYLALWWRDGLAQAEAQRLRTCYEAGLGYSSWDTVSTDIEYDELHAEYSEFLARVTSKAHVIEDALSETVYSPLSLGATVEEGDGVSSGCGETISFDSPRMDRGGSNPETTSIYRHIENDARYLAQWGDKLNAYHYFFPKDETGAIKSYEWLINLSRANPTDFWLLLSQQYVTNPYLNRGENTKEWTSLISAPLYYGGLSGWIATYRGLQQYTSNVGICRPDIQTITPDASVVLDSGSSALFSTVDCSAAFGSQIVLTPSASDIELALPLNSFTTPPYGYGNIAKEFKLEWETANIDSISVVLRNDEGDEVEIASATAADWKERPLAADSVYAGDWAQDFSGLLGLTIFGVDTEPEGRSLTYQLDAALSHHYGLLAGRGAVELVWKITVISTGSDVTLEYPEMRVSDEASEIVSLTPFAWAQFWKDGPAIRFGQQRFDDGAGGMSLPPSVRVPGIKPTVVDAIAYRRLIYENQAAGLAAVEAELASLYDTVEGQTVAVHANNTDAFLWLDGATAKLVLHNTYRNTPPNYLEGVPDNEFEAGAESPPDLVCRVYSHAQEPRRYLSAHRPIEVREPGGASITALSAAFTNTPWQVSEHSEAMDNTELDDYELYWDGDQYATVSPWFGYYGILGWATGGGGVWNLVTPMAEYHKAEAIDGDIYYYRSKHTIPVAGFDSISQVTSTGKDSHPRMALAGPAGRIALLWEREDPAGTWNIYEAFSDDEGRTWSTPSVGLSGARRPTINGHEDGPVVRAGFKYNSGSSGPGKIHSSRQRDGDTSPGAYAAIVDTAGSAIEIEDDSFHLYPTADNRWLLVCVVSGESASSDWVSDDDGQSFTRIT